MSKPAGNVNDIRTFAITLFLVLAILGSFFLWRKGPCGFVFWGVGAALLIPGVLRPGILSPVYRAWMKLALVLGFVSSHVVLAVMYYFVITPISLLMRALGKDPLQKNIDTAAKSYWMQKERTAFVKEQYEKMF